MTIGYTGSPAKGYDVQELLGAIGRFLDTRLDQRVALVGVGNLGRALLSYFVGRHPQFSITAAFDADPKKAGRVINGCPVYALEQLVEVVDHEDICLALITVPAEAAQETANLLCKAGVRGLLNFAPVRLWVPEGVHVENLDMTLSLEKVAYFACARRSRKGSAR
jgi:redox-sensing transcriptional repressor